MTEREAWKFLAKLWSNPIIEEETGFAFVEITDKTGNVHKAVGLCSCFNANVVSDVTGLSLIPSKLYWRMHKKIRDFRRKLGYDRAYIWTVDENGAKARVKFCKAMANRKPYTSLEAVYK